MRHSVFTLRWPATWLAASILALSGASEASSEESLGEIGSPARSIRVIEVSIMAPEIAFNDATGRHWGFVEFRGRPIVVTFWATWCPICFIEMPKLDRLQAELQDAGLAVIALSLGKEGIPTIERYYARRGIRNLKVFHDPEAVMASVLGIEGVPTTFIIDRHGYMVGVVEGGVEWSAPEVQTFLRKHLK